MAEYVGIKFLSTYHFNSADNMSEICYKESNINFF